MNIKLLSATENNNETPEGELMRNIGISFAEYERNIIRKRIKSGIKYAASKGKYPNKAPIGYKNTPDGIIIDNKLAPYIKQCFEMALSGENLKSISKTLYTEGFINKKGDRVPPARIKSILKNKIYTGKFDYNGIEYKGNHTPLVSLETFEKVQTNIL